MPFRRERPKEPHSKSATRKGVSVRLRPRLLIDIREESRLDCTPQKAQLFYDDALKIVRDLAIC